jgi:CheY-like chemotaxis protein
MTINYKTVLIVEDSPAQALVLQQVLEQEGLQVLWAPNGRIGVAMAQQQMPDAIVLDIEMPEMNGFEVCRRLKENIRTSRIPIVMLTIRTDPSALMQGIDLGAIDFIPKDAFSESVLIETLRQLRILDDPQTTENDWAGD